MAVNQPPITDDPVETSWSLEVTRELNRLLAEVEALRERVRQLEQTP